MKKFELLCLMTAIIRTSSYMSTKEALETARKIYDEQMLATGFLTEEACRVLKPRE